MNVEVRKTANGYMVMPAYSFPRGDRIPDSHIYVFNDFGKMFDKLQELLSQQYDEDSKK